MAKTSVSETVEVSLTENDVSTFRENGILSIEHPNGGIIVLVTTDSFDIKKTGSVKRTPLFTGNTFTKLENGGTVDYTDLRVRME